MAGRAIAFSTRKGRIGKDSFRLIGEPPKDGIRICTLMRRRLGEKIHEERMAGIVVFVCCHGRGYFLVSVRHGHLTLPPK